MSKESPLIPYASVAPERVLLWTEMDTRHPTKEDGDCFVFCEYFDIPPDQCSYRYQWSNRRMGPATYRKAKYWRAAPKCKYSQFDWCDAKMTGNMTPCRYRTNESEEWSEGLLVAKFPADIVKNKYFVAKDGVAIAVPFCQTLELLPDFCVHDWIDLKQDRWFCDNCGRINSSEWKNDSDWLY